MGSFSSRKINQKMCELYKIEVNILFKVFFQLQVKISNLRQSAKLK